MPEHIYDKGYKKLFSKKKHFLQFLHKYLKLQVAENLSLNDLEMIDKSFVDPAFREQESDVIYRLKNDKLDIVFYVLLELQSSVDQTMPARLLFYMTELLRRSFRDVAILDRERKDFKLPAVVPIILYNGGEKWTVARSFKEYTSGSEYFQSNIIDFEYMLIDLNQTDETFILSTNNVLDLVFVLDRGRDPIKAKKSIQTVLKHLHSLPQEDRPDVWEYFCFVLQRTFPDSLFYLISEMKEQFMEGDEKDMEYAIEHAFKVERNNGRQEGLEKGREVEKIEIAKKMLQAQAETDFIMKMTGLSKSVLDELKKQIAQ